MLARIIEFFNLLDKKGITYCQWKSNERLGSFLSGESDLDLLFYSSDQDKIEEIFSKIGAKKFEILRFSKYKNIIDYLQVDEKTGKIIHYHVYFRLELGEPNVKQYLIEWSDEILLNRIKHEQYNVWIPSHEHELVLLILREVLRIPYLKMLIIKNSYFKLNFSNKMIGEFNWLKKRVDKKKFISTVNKLFSEKKNITDAFEYIFENSFSFKKISELFDNLESFKQENKIKNSFYSHYNFIKLIFTSKLFLFKKSSDFKNRINPRKGLLVAVIGSDGAGKSTLIQNLKKEFGRKINVKNFYFGSPKSEKISIFPWLKIITFFGLKPFLNLFLKKINLRKAINLRNKGLLILCDRFPQSKYEKLLDGPRLSIDNNSNNFLKKWASNYEKKEFEKIFNSKIDLVIKLKVDENLSSSRGKLPIDLAKKKTQAIENLIFPNCNKHYELNAISNSSERIKIQTTNIIWKNID